MSFAPTAEQQAALDAFATGKNMVIEAGAGTGKTSTLRLLAESTDRKGLYVAYNKAIQTDAEKIFPSNCECRTAHSLAYRAVVNMPEGKALMARLRSPRVTSREAVSILGAKDLVIGEQTVPAWIIARTAMETVSRFCNSASDEITEYHVPFMNGLEEQGPLRSYVASLARKAWLDLNSPKGRLKFAHDHYLKIWALSHPKLDAEFILLDEAQDANPVIANMVEEQVHAQQIMVGDACQAIYAWRGAVDAMSEFAVDHRLVLSQSFRFGPAVAAQANLFLGLLDAPLRLSGYDKIESTVAPLGNECDAILCRTNAGVISHAMEAQAAGRKVAIVGGTGEIKAFTEGARELMNGSTSSHRDLCMFKSWDEVMTYAQDEEGRDLKVMVKLILDYGVETVLEVCNNSVKEDSADLIVSTAHKAKGREWNRVRIANDFKAPEEGEQPSRPEMMLMYVAVTRAKLVLDHSGVSWIDTLVAA